MLISKSRNELLLVLVIAITFLLAGCSSTSDGMKSAIPKIVKELKNDSGGLNVSHLPSASHLPKFDQAELISYQLPVERGVADKFKYTIYVISDKEYWIVRRGGIASVYEVFGPGEVSKLGIKD